MRRADLTAFDSITANVALLDSAGNIISVNEAWRAFGRDNGLSHPEACVGCNYLEACKAANAPHDLIEGLSDLLAGRQTVLTHWYPCHAPNQKRWFIMFGIREVKSHTVALMHVEATDWISDPTLEQLEIERPDRMADARLHLSVQTAVARLMPAVMAKMARTSREPTPSKANRDAVRDVEAKLTKKQAEIFRHLRTGRSNQQIAELVGAAPSTVKLHVMAILKRLNLRTRAEAVALSASIHRLPSTS